MSKVSFGVEIHPYYDVPSLMHEVTLAEELGYDQVWFGDSQLIWREMYVLMGAAAQATSRVLLGTGVTNPITRVSAVTASAAATLQELSGGRLTLGIGNGFTSVNTMGRKPATRAQLEACVDEIRALCRGDRVPMESGDMRLMFGAPEKCPPIAVAASGPKMLRLAGGIGDGVVLARVAMEGDMLARMLECVHRGRREAGRDAQPFRRFLSVSAAVDVDGSKAVSVVRPHVARAILKPFWGLSPAAAAAAERMTGRYDNYQHLNPNAAHADSVPDEVVPEFALAGTPSRCIEKAARMFDSGIDQITIRPYAVDGRPRASMIRAFAEQVMHPMLGGER